MKAKQTTWTTVKATVWIPLLTSLLVLGLGLLISSVRTQIGTLPLVTAVAVCVFIFYLAMRAMIVAVMPASVGLLEEIKNHVDRYVDKNAVTWMLTNEQLAELEAKPEVHEVWLVTADLGDDIPGSLFFDVVHANLVRGVKYRYFVPRSLQAEARGRQLQEAHGKQADLYVHYLSDDFFFLVPRLDFAIYDPMNIKGCRAGYMGLPVHSQTKYHGLMEASFVDLMIGKLQKLIEAP